MVHNNNCLYESIWVTWSSVMCGTITINNVNTTDYNKMSDAVGLTSRDQFFFGNFIPDILIFVPTISPVAVPSV